MKLTVCTFGTSKVVLLPFGKGFTTYEELLVDPQVMGSDYDPDNSPRLTRWYADTVEALEHEAVSPEEEIDETDVMVVTGSYRPSRTLQNEAFGSWKRLFRNT